MGAEQSSTVQEEEPIVNISARSSVKRETLTIAISEPHISLPSETVTKVDLETGLERENASAPAAANDQQRVGTRPALALLRPATNADSDIPTNRSQSSLSFRFSKLESNNRVGVTLQSTQESGVVISEIDKGSMLELTGGARILTSHLLPRIISPAPCLDLPSPRIALPPLLPAPRP